MTEVKDEIFLPTLPHEPEINASSLIIFGKEKCGKTTVLFPVRKLSNCGHRKWKHEGFCYIYYATKG